MGFGAACASSTTAAAPCSICLTARRSTATSARSAIRRRSTSARPRPRSTCRFAAAETGGRSSSRLPRRHARTASRSCKPSCRPTRSRASSCRFYPRRARRRLSRNKSGLREALGQRRDRRIIPHERRRQPPSEPVLQPCEQRRRLDRLVSLVARELAVRVDLAAVDVQQRGELVDEPVVDLLARGAPGAGWRLRRLRGRRRGRRGRARLRALRALFGCAVAARVPRHERGHPPRHATPCALRLCTRSMCAAPAMRLSATSAARRRDGSARYEPATQALNAPIAGPHHTW